MLCTHIAVGAPICDFFERFGLQAFYWVIKGSSVINW